MEINVNIGYLYKAYQALGGCRLTKLSDDDKFTLWKDMKAIAPIVEKFNNEIQMAVELFRMEDNERYNALVDRALAEYSNCDATLDIEPLSQEAIDLLTEENGWDFQQQVFVRGILLERQ